MLDGCIDKPANLGKLDNLVKFAFNFATSHPKNCTIEKDILSTG